MKITLTILFILSLAHCGLSQSDSNSFFNKFKDLDKFVLTINFYKGRGKYPKHVDGYSVDYSSDTTRIYYVTQPYHKKEPPRRRLTLIDTQSKNLINNLIQIETEDLSKSVFGKYVVRFRWEENSKNESVQHRINKASLKILQKRLREI